MTILNERLQGARNADGGWGYFAGKQSRLEPTCWALLAVERPGGTRGGEILQRWPTREGLLLERPGGTVNVAFHALAISALLTRGVEHESGTASLVASLQGERGVTLPPSTLIRQDNKLQGWAWVADTFSWVEPTAWALIALSQWLRHHPNGVDVDRVRQGEQMLIDRVCREGGWNYGNSNALGADLAPHVPTTALGLLALQSRRDDDATLRSLAWLEAHAAAEPAGMTLGLACLALRAYGRPDEAPRAELEARLSVTLDFGNVCSLAAAALALEPAGPTSAFGTRPL